MSPCPICRRTAAPSAEKAAFPFCSARCKLIDLGKWLDESYRVPARPGFSSDGDEENAGPIEGDT
ncbi:MAG: DNA gyrase inhibitor YacG [Myxococcota bacterium]|nr:DNA gyrase inhibitor YacG [Myxococcota bacterium]